MNLSRFLAIHPCVSTKVIFVYLIKKSIKIVYLLTLKNRMKKITIIICLTFSIGLSVKGQLNPVKNLQWTIKMLLK